jgi:hypothetical protein
LFDLRIHSYVHLVFAVNKRAIVIDLSFVCVPFRTFASDPPLRFGEIPGVSPY